MQVSLLFATTNAEALIERCARICYRSEDKTTPTSAIPLIRGLLSKTPPHEGIIEPNRFVFEIQPDNNKAWYAPVSHLLGILGVSPLIKFTRKGDGFLLSGNARMWRDAWDALPRAISYELKQTAPILFGHLGEYEYLPHTTIDATPQVELWGLHIPEGLSREELLAHGAATVYLHGVSRALTHQLVRHRMASYSMASQRYCREDGFKYVIPPSLDGPVMYGDLYSHRIDSIGGTYRALVSNGMPKEDARYILPNAACTEIAITMTLEHWQHFLELRCDPRAQWEIRQVSEQIKSLLTKSIPQVFEES